MSLKEYRRKRDFAKTAEPKSAAGRGKQRGFVIQKHAARRLHYDFRLEMNGALKSWALPKGLPYTRGEKHLAVQVEDHPLAYADFEGIIPPGQYGGGTVMVWDRGTFEPQGRAPLKDWKNGKLAVALHGEKLEGEWHLVRLRGEDNQWLIIKGGDSMKPLSKKRDDQSVLSGRTMEQLAAGDRVWQSARAASQRPGRKRSKPARAAPLPGFVEPMKARLASAPPPGQWSYEIKFDGWRALALKGGSQARLLSRNAKDLGAKFPEVMEAVARLDAQDAVLDGEIVALDAKGRSSFQMLQAHEMNGERPPIFYYVFDLLQLNGEDLKNLPLEERRTRLQKILGSAKGAIRLSLDLGSDVAALLEQARGWELEGLIGKKRGSRYESGRRSGSWIKLKLVREQEFVIGGYTDPAGTRRHFGALLVGYYKGRDLLFAGKVGTGFDAARLRSLHERLRGESRASCPFANLPSPRAGRWGQGVTRAEMKSCHWVKPDVVCQIKFGEWTRDGRLRQPVFLGLRPDKDAREVVREGRAHG